MTIAAERWSTLWPDIEPLFRAHHRETGLDVPFAPNVAAFEAMDAAGMLLTTTARNASLVGYIMWYLSPSLENASMLCASQGPWFVRPGMRGAGVGLQLFRASLPVLRGRGVHTAFPHYWTRSAGPALGKFFERLGAHEISREYALTLGSTELAREE